ncbi:MAG: hypothetical protein Q7T80_03060 [Methanoregula sp.]|nr:hypothetical protein [Methanoregula sp.]
MRLAYVGLSIALALFIIAQGVSKPVFFYALVIPVIVFMYGVMAKETLPETKDDDEETADKKDDLFGFF